MSSTSTTNDDFQERYAQVPTDFPRTSTLGALPGAQRKFSAVEYEGRFYAVGCTPPEILERWEICEELAAQFAKKCQRNEPGKYAHLSREQILEQYCARLRNTGWGSDAEMRWVIRRVATLLYWPVPPNAIDKTEQRLDDGQ